MPSLKIFFSCSGVGILDRGIETFFREAFDGLRGVEGLDVTLYKGAGAETSDEKVLWNLPRNGYLAPLLGACINRNSYVVEQLSTFPSMVRAIRKHQPDIIYYSDASLGFQLFRWRKQIGVPFRLLFSNGGPVNPPFRRTDFVQQVTPYYYDRAIAAGELPNRQRMVPYGISVPEGAPDVSELEKRALQKRLGLPLDRQIVISVGWISSNQKRMDYLVSEVAKLATPRPYLVMIGAMDETSESVIRSAAQTLGGENFTARSVPYRSVADYYRAADLFVLASLREGFGRVFLEALIHGLPVIAHDHPVMRYVIGGHGTFIDLSKVDALTGAILNALKGESSIATATARRESVRQRFSWPVLVQQYSQMFYDCFRDVTPIIA